MSNGKPVCYDDSAVQYGEIVPQSVEVVSGKIDVAAGVVTIANSRGLATAQIVGGSVLLTFEQPQALGYGAFFQFNPKTTPALIISAINESTSAVGISCVDHANAPVNLAVGNFALSFSIQQPA